MIDIDVLGVRGDVPADVALCEEILDAVLSSGASCAPRVVARLVTEVSTDAGTITAIVTALDADQRRGLSPLPDPLPLVRPIAELFADVELEDRDRTLLLAAALSLDDRLEPLLELDGRTRAELTGGALCAHLTMRAGRARLTDPRLGVWLRASASPSATVAVHERLHRVFAARGEQLGMRWHGARGALQHAPGAAGVLTELAQLASAAGDDERALLLAAEAARHTSGDALHAAQSVAGLSALASGYAAEATTHLAALIPDADARHRIRALGGLIVARAHLRGAVPELPPAMVSPSGTDEDGRRSWARAAAGASVLCAERGDHRGMRAWLDALRRTASADEGLHGLRDPVVALALLIAGDARDAEPEADRPPSGRTLGALRAALDGDVDRGLRVLGSGEGMADDADPLIAGISRSALVAAYRAVTEVLLLTWRGDIGLARTRMLRAALDLPVTVPFAGLGVVLARRLDMHVLGDLGPISRALTSALPAGTRLDRLVDRGIRAYLEGATDDAACIMRLWFEQGRPGPRFDVPGLEEIAPAALKAAPASGATAVVGTADHRIVADIFARIARCAEDEWRLEHPMIADAARSLVSPFLRGRVELALAHRSLVRGDVARGVEHLRTARELFELSGAVAWRRLAEARLERLLRSRSDGDRARAPGAGCRQVWEPILTARELEVAMLTVGGASNRGIAAELRVSVRTVEVHLGRVFGKLDVKGRVELTILAHRLDQRVGALAYGSPGE